MPEPLPKTISANEDQPSLSEEPESSLRDGSTSHPFKELDIPKLTQAAQRGDHAAFEQLYHALFTPLYRYLLVCSGGREQESQEILQEILVRMARHIKRFDRPTDLWNWIRCIGRNLLTDYRRKTNRKPSLRPLEPEFDPISTSSERDDLHELSQHLDHCLDRLDPMERALIYGKYMETKSHATLAREYDLTTKAVESRLARIRKKLKSLMIERLNP